MRDSEFQQANTAFKGVMHLNKQSGHNTSRPHNSISPADLDMLYENHVNQWSRCPMHLQHKVWFDILYYMGRHGQEGMHKITKEAFAVKENAEGRKYVCQTFNDVTKKSKGDDTSVSR